MRQAGNNRFRTNEALCYLSNEATYLGPDGGRLGISTQAWKEDAPPAHGQRGPVLKHT